jgi:hypothetical protein
MPVKIKVQKDYFMTEVSADLPADVGELNDELLAIGTTGKMVVQYNHGSVQGINVEQRTKIPDNVADEIRKLLGIGTKIS